MRKLLIPSVTKNVFLNFNPLRFLLSSEHFCVYPRHQPKDKNKFSFSGGINLLSIPFVILTNPLYEGRFNAKSLRPLLTIFAYNLELNLKLPFLFDVLGPYFINEIA